MPTFSLASLRVRLILLALLAVPSFRRWG